MNQLTTSVQSAEQAIREKFGIELQQKLRAKYLLYGGAALVGLVVIGGVVVSALLAAVQIAVLGGLLGALALGGLVSWKKIPRWILSVENREKELIRVEMNRHLASLKSEAKKNPIEQAQNDYLSRSAQYAQFKAAMEKIGGKVGSFKSKLDKTMKEKPQYDLTQETLAYEKMNQFYENRMARLKEAVIKLAKFKEKIEEASTKWEFQLDANDAIRAMNATDQEAKINEILTEVAFGTVQQEFDAVFAKLDVDAAELTATRSLEFGSGMTIDVSAIRIEERELVPVQLEAARR